MNGQPSLATDRAPASFPLLRLLFIAFHVRLTAGFSAWTALENLKIRQDSRGFLPYQTKNSAGNPHTLIESAVPVFRAVSTPLPVL